jgi:hypothetical protein
MAVFNRAEHQVLRVNVFYRPKAQRYWAESPDINGLAASGKTRQDVVRQAFYAAHALFAMKGIKARPELTFRDAEGPPE